MGLTCPMMQPMALLYLHIPTWYISTSFKQLIYSFLHRQSVKMESLQAQAMISYILYWQALEGPKATEDIIQMFSRRVNWTLSLCFLNDPFNEMAW